MSIPAPLIVDAARIRAAVPLDHAAIEVTTSALELVAGDTITMPPIQQIRMRANDGQTCIKSAALAGAPRFVTKISSIFPDAALGRSHASGLMMLFDAATGYPAAILLDNGWLTAVRTAAAGAVAARALARADSRRVAVIGSGRQALMQVQALRLVFDVEAVAVYARDADRGCRLAETITAEGLLATYFPALDDATVDADIIVTTTAARDPLLHREHVRPGTHITAMGSDAAGKSELGSSLLAAARVYACDSIEQCRLIGEAGAADARGDAPPLTPVALGSLLGMPQSRDATAITIADLTGVAIQDLMIAELALDRLGSAIEGRLER